jgi:dihydroxyacetone kinase
LSTAVAGNIFASPNVNQIRRGIQLAAQGQGVLIIIMR